jgi:hypothetical protein
MLMVTLRCLNRVLEDLVEAIRLVIEIEIVNNVFDGITESVNSMVVRSVL